MTIEKKIDEIIIFLDLKESNRNSLEEVIKNKVLVMVLKQENKDYLLHLRRVGLKIIKKTKALQKLYLKGQACADLFPRSDFKNEPLKDVTVKSEDFKNI